jgi:hypothetical protein
MRSIVSPLDGFASPFGPQRGFNPLRLFTNDEPGVWFEANDATTLFTDVAGTTPVTAPGDAVALQLDKSGRGNHRTQATVAARPLYALQPVGGVRNLLEYTDPDAPEPTNWTDFSATDGLDKSLATLSNGINGIRFNTTKDRPRISQTVTLLPATTYTLSLYVDPGSLITSKVLQILQLSDATGDLTANASEVDADGRLSITFTTGSDVSGAVQYGLGLDGPQTGDITLGGIQLELGSTATNYQRVGSFLDVSEEGKARRGRLWYNGTSHFMETGTITPGTDKVQVFAGVRKLSDAAVGILIESSTISETSNGAFGIAAPGSSAKLIAISRGTIIRTAGTTSAAYNAPTTRVVSAFSDISGDRVALHIDGTQVAQSTESQGTGNFLAYPIYFGARAGTSLFYNGYEDTSIIRFGPNLDDTTISKVESYVASKTPAAELLIPAGPELVTNGTFDTDVSGWSSGNGVLTWNAAGYADFDRNGESFGNHIYQNISTVSGKVYLLSYDIVALSNQVDLRVRNETVQSVTTIGTKSYAFVASGATTEIEFDAAQSSSATFSLDNISVRQFIPK